jgi:hypothetical protein
MADPGASSEGRSVGFTQDKLPLALVDGHLAIPTGGAASSHRGRARAGRAARGSR